MFLLWVLAMIIYIIAKVVVRFMEKLPKNVMKIFIKIKEYFEWSGIIRTWITSYIEVLLAAGLQVWHISFGSVYKGFSTTLAIIICLVSVLFPVMGFIRIKQAEKDRAKRM